MDAGVLNRLVQIHDETQSPIVTAEYAGTVGVPVLFARAYFPHLRALAPGQGCKGVIMNHRKDSMGMPCPEAETDIDTPEDYRRVLELLGLTRPDRQREADCHPDRGR